MYARVRVNNGKAIPAYRVAYTKNIILSIPTLVAKYMFSKEVPDAFIESTQKIEAANVQKIIIILLSLLSEKKPIGHWNIPPAKDIKNINSEISKIVKFIVAA